MVDEEQIKKEAKQKAYEDACQNGCALADVCPNTTLEEKKAYCDVFADEYAYYIDELVEEACTEERGIASCLNCDDYWRCNYFILND